MNSLANEGCIHQYVLKSFKDEWIKFEAETSCEHVRNAMEILIYSSFDATDFLSVCFCTLDKQTKPPIRDLRLKKFQRILSTEKVEPDW